MRLHNTRTHKVEEFQPLTDSTVRIYSCGPTVYNHAHIGNLSSYIYADILHRALAANGYQVKHVMNFTDVDDKTIRDSKAKYPNDDPMERLKRFTEHYEMVFLNEMRSVGNDIDSIQFVKATDNIAGMHELIKRLLNQGIAYVADDGIYFSIAKYRQNRVYGQLSNIEFTDGEAGQERINNDEYDKDHVHDFALWKRQKEGEPAWDFWIDDNTNIPGRPGWHIECSVMSTKNLGQPFDIHTGGVDLIFPHHENEIAQSTAGNQPELYANFFVHNEHLLVDGKKMSKSAHNFYTLPDLIERGFSSLDFRMLTLQSHYRSATNFSWDNLAASHNRRRNWRNIAELRWQSDDSHDEQQLEQVKVLLDSAKLALWEDLDTPEALKHIDQAFDLFTPADINYQALELLINQVDQLLGMKLLDTTADLSDGDYDLISQRQEARANKDYAKSDLLRDELKSRGVNIKDGVQPIWSRD